jgi:hypothetical protein
MVDSSYGYGTVAYTSPGSGATAATGSTVTIYVSDGTPYVPPAPSTPKKQSTGGGNGGTTGPGPGNGHGNGRGNGHG